MIKLTRIHGEEVYINDNNIQWIECLPDTTITLLNGTRFIVKESVDTIIQLMKQGNTTSYSAQSKERPEKMPTQYFDNKRFFT